MLDQVLEVFDIRPDADLDLMRPNQTLSGLTARAIEAIDGYLAAERPDLVLVQGDTTTVFCASLAAFYRHVPIGHVEAGLRTGDLTAPWPEEANRVLTSRLARLHFAPTATSRENLLREGTPGRCHFGDGKHRHRCAVHRGRARSAAAARPSLACPRRCSQPRARRRASRGWSSSPATGARTSAADSSRSAAPSRELAARFPDVHFVYPVHLNPNVRGPVRRFWAASRAKPAAREPPTCTSSSRFRTCRSSG